MRLGISPRRFLGEEPRSITRYFYDDAGVLTHTITSPDPEWDERNRAIVLAFMAYRNDIHSCGRPLSESLHKAGQPDPEYVMGELVCVACKRSDEYVKRHHKKDGLPPGAVLQVYTRAEAQAIHDAQRG